MIKELVSLPLIAPSAGDEPAAGWHGFTAVGAAPLRADFIYHKYDPLQVRTEWRAVRASRPVPGGHAANFDRGML